ncbi:dTDP-4-dehydrorhamnose reductase [Rhizobiales bacterium L72]|uniref:dTDP-4-dehydrorhamnose reductase n=1 Tax=Propylenella binzhouense TaxID=2555902 RepID=A0A964T287_9HYPH|nr:dTDP-4-dehydrorhamnose reductase [Propylenella binzhouense]MYZ47068.1 dTDP-4-dehydrorhamnose reductase [Propylenella binzhouense]
MLVAGRSGQLAHALAGSAAPPGWRIVCRGREDGFELTDPASMRAQIGALAPAAIVNTAAYTAVDRAETDADAAYAVNRDGPAALAELAAAAGVPLLHISTDYVFDGRKAEAYVETDPVCPVGVYGASKADGEEAVRQRLPAHLILRTSWVYSPFAGNFVKTMLKLAETREEVAVVADQRGCPTAACDLAAAILAVVDRIGTGAPMPYGTYHVAGSGETTWYDFARFVFACAAHRRKVPKVRPVTTADYPTPAVRPANSRLDCAKFERAFGLRLPAWQASVRQCVDVLTHEPCTSG